MPGGAGGNSGLFDDALELGWFDEVANDLPWLVEVKAQLWRLRAGAAVDPVHYDFVAERYVGPYEVVASAVDGFDKTLTMTDTGLEEVRETELWLTRAECERVAFGAPRTGDVIAILTERLPSPYYFYIQSADQAGRLPQGRAFVMWRLNVRLTSKAPADETVGAEEGGTCGSLRRID